MIQIFSLEGSPTFLYRKKSVALFFFVLAVIIFLDKLVFGPYSLIRLSDTFDGVFPYFSAYGENFFSHGLTTWFQFEAGGRPSHAYHHGPLFPLNIVSEFLPLWAIYSITSILLTMGAGYGMWRLLTDYVRVTESLAILGGVIYVFSSLTQPFHLVIEIFNYVFPLFFMWTVVDEHKTFRSTSIRFLGILLIMFFSFPILTLPEFCLVQLGFILILSFNKTQKRKRMTLRWFYTWIAYGLVFFPVIYSLYDYQDLSQRTSLLPRETSLSDSLIEHLLELNIKSLMVFFVGGSLVIFFRDYRVRKICLLGLFVIVMISLDTSSVANLYRNTFFTHLEFSQLSFTLDSLFVILGVVALDSAISQKIEPRFLIGGLVGIILLFLYYFPTVYHALLCLNIFVAVTAIIYAFEVRVQSRSIFLSRLVNRSMLVFFLLIVIAFTRVHRFGNGMEDTPFRTYFSTHEILEDLAVRSKTRPGRVATLGFFPAMATSYGLETADVFAPIYAASYRDYWTLIVEEQLLSEHDKRRYKHHFYDLNLLNGPVEANFSESAKSPFNKSLKLNIPLLLASNVTHIISSRPVKELEEISTKIVTNSDDIENTEKVTSFLNKYVAKLPPYFFALTGSKVPKYQANYFSPVPMWLYELDNRFERGYLVSNEIYLSSDDKILSMLKHQSLDDFRNNVLLSSSEDYSEDRPILLNSNANNGATLSYYSPDKLIFDVRTSDKAVLVVTNNYHPNWSASIDQKPVKLYRANHTFQAVIIDSPGDQQVILEYKDSLVWYTYLSIPIGIIFVLINCFSRINPIPRRAT